ncbi:MAG: hypothetical protein ACKN84_03510 [Candidatus Fonsibacter sp.]|jgi:uncharacterized small protein (DUF1192 family)
MLIDEEEITKKKIDVSKLSIPEMEDLINIYKNKIIELENKIVQRKKDISIAQTLFKK